MTDIPIKNYDDGDNDQFDCQTPDFSEILSDENELNTQNDFIYTTDESQQEESKQEKFQQKEFQQLNLTNYFTNTTYQNENQQEYTNTTTESLDGKEIKDVIVEIFSESFKENTEMFATTNEDFTINHFKTFLQNICTQFNDLNQSKQKEQQNKKELNEQCKKIERQVNEKEQDHFKKIGDYMKRLQKKENEHEKQLQVIEQEHANQLKVKEQDHKKQINSLQQIVNGGKKDIMKEIGEKQINTNENISLNDQLTELINYCKNDIKTKNEHEKFLKKEVVKLSIEKEKCEMQFEKLNQKLIQQSSTKQQSVQQQLIQQPSTKQQSKQLTQQQINENELKQPRKIPSKPKIREVIIPRNYNKDVYYYEYTNRKELFLQTEKEFNKIPIYFPIPVLKYMRQYTVIFHIYSSLKASPYIQFNVTIEID
ncbi:hypothetical protein QTN25_006918 [Entamoeba marina]